MKNEQFKKNDTLHASFGYELAIIPLGFFLEYEHLFWLVCIIIFIGVLGSILITVFTGRNPTWNCLDPPSECDTFNIIGATARKHPDPNKYHLTKILCNQFIHNHSKRITVTYENFPIENSICHMNGHDQGKFALIMESMPQSSIKYAKYKVEGGLVRFKTTNNPVHSNWDVLQAVYFHESQQR